MTGSPPSQTAEVQISDELLEQASELQETRNSGEYINSSSVNKNPVQDHYIGAIGELIAADWFGVNVDWEARCGDDGIDLVYETDDQEISMDVKTTEYASGSLVMPRDVAQDLRENDDKTLPTIYLLIRQKSEYRWEIAGWTTPDEFLSEDTLCPMLSGGDGMNHKLDADQLYNVQAPQSDLDLCQLLQTGDCQFVGDKGREAATASN